MWAQQEQRSPARIVSGAGSLKSPGKKGGADFSPRPRQRACQDPFDAAGWRCPKAGPWNPTLSPWTSQLSYLAPSSWNPALNFHLDFEISYLGCLELDLSLWLQTSGANLCPR
jgi:hypothetical protein